MFNKLIDFPSQLTQMSPPIDQGRQAKELVLAFDDIVLKKLRAGLGTPEKHELFFDFLQDVYDCNLLPAFLTYLGHFIGVSYNSKECPDGSLTDLPPQKKSKLKINDDQDNTIDDFIKNITIRYETDSQISIQQKGKPKMNVEMTALNFKEGGSKVTWNNFLTVLKDSPRHYWEVPDRPLNQLKTINERLITGSMPLT